MIEQLSIADVENILLRIHDIEQDIAAEKDKCDQSVAFFKARIDEAKNIFEQVTKDAQDTLAILKAKLERYFNDNPPTKTKSLKFAGGSFGYNKAQTKYFLNGVELNADNKDLLAIVDKDYVKTKTYVDWAKFKTKLTFMKPDEVFISDTGELVEGLRAQRVFSVKTS